MGIWEFVGGRGERPEEVDSPYANGGPSGSLLETFLDELVARGEEEVDHSVFDLLLSLAEFDAFKQQMLTYGVLKTDLGIMGVASTIHQDEDEDGEIRKDLEDLLIIGPASPKPKKK